MNLGIFWKLYSKHVKWNRTNILWTSFKDLFIIVKYFSWKKNWLNVFRHIVNFLVDVRYIFHFYQTTLSYLDFDFNMFLFFLDTFHVDFWIPDS